ncbi:class I SAM-dependent methyltransferase [Salipaludibacillus sp. CUR1]|uniref:class I SAM-dependent methyltransferase n=1 Tax=Salipaludibacillus sp. CUR1 TaxID=2820003 RepID=UPI001E48761E|nr:class I SAM-dependent methyltransferase [Salipaludibacillus sp. CUR1]MCE7791647.1 class I SAM-dependent methyltransferase [Salipaludibacillus sp. CUR1]
MAGHRFNPEKADKLLDPNRTSLIDPDWVADKLKLPSEAHVMDLGAGNGFFTLPLAERTSGEVYAVDVEPEMLGLLGVRAEEKGAGNIGLIESDLEDIPLEDGTAEASIAAFVIHEVGDRLKAFNEMNRIMKEGSKGAIVEWARVEGESGPPLHERLDPEILIDEMKSSGLIIDELVEKEEVYVIFFSTKSSK